jgi:protein-disulfide isomerase
MTIATPTRRSLLKGAAAATLATTAGLPAMAQDIEVTEMVMGDADAPVEVIEYASLTCPHCARFHTDVFPQLRANYIDTGKIRFVFREVYFDRFGLWGGMLARCDESRYFGVVDLLLKQQADWSRAGDPAAIVQAMRRVGAQAGLSQEQMEQCLSDGDTAQALVDEYQRNAERDNVRGTPSFIINGTPYGNMGYAAFVDAIEAELEG